MRGRPSTTVMVLPPRPFFSILSLAVTRAGTGSSTAARVLHWQFFAGQPHFGQVRP